MILYLAQAYSIDPAKAFQNAAQWTKSLRKMGFFVFSPILHTHPYHSLLKNSDWDYTAEEDYVAWDLAIVDAMCLPIPKCGAIEAGYSQCCHDQCIDCNFRSRITEHWKCLRDAWVQPNVAMVFADDCLSKGYMLDPMSQGDWDKNWFVNDKKSKGAKMEYDFAVKHHIRCLRLTELLKVVDQYTFPLSDEQIIDSIDECEAL
jgi:hypothetical protein